MRRKSYKGKRRDWGGRESGRVRSKDYMEKGEKGMGRKERRKGEMKDYMERRREREGKEGGEVRSQK